MSGNGMVSNSPSGQTSYALKKSQSPHRERNRILRRKTTRASIFGGDGPSGGRHGGNAGGARRETRRTTDCGKPLCVPARKRFALPAAASAVRCSQGLGNQYDRRLRFRKWQRGTTYSRT